MAANILNLPLSTYAKLSPHPHLVSLLSSTDATAEQQQPGFGAAKPAKPATPRRANGRAPLEARPVHVHVSALSHSHGSAVVRTGDTTVICGVRSEILPVENIPLHRSDNIGFGNGDDGLTTTTTTTTTTRNDVDELRDYDLLVPNIEFASGCAPQFLPGGPPSVLAQTLSTRVYSLLHASRLLDAADLRIWYTKESRGGPEDTRMEMVMDDDENVDEEQGEEEQEEENRPQLVAYWVLYIDLLFVSFDGNPLDAAWTAVMAALRNTRLPSAQWDPDREMVVCSPSSSSSATRQPRALSLSGLPVTCSAAVLRDKDQDHSSVVAVAGQNGGPGRHWLLLDPDRLEESLCRELATVVVDRSSGETRIRSIEKHGGTFAGRDLVKELIGLAERRWEDVRMAIKEGG